MFRILHVIILLMRAKCFDPAVVKIQIIVDIRALRRTIHKIFMFNRED